MTTPLVILDVEETPTRISKEVDATETMIERTEERFALKPKYLAGDVAGACPRESGGHRRGARLAGRPEDRSTHPGLGQERA